MSEKKIVFDGKDVEEDIKKAKAEYEKQLAKLKKEEKERED